MAKPLNVDTCKDGFIYEIDIARRLKGAVEPLMAVKHTSTKKLHPKHVRLIVELAFMGVVESWQEFLERTLVRYLAGAASKSGYRPHPKVGLCKNLDHAYQVISRNPKFDRKKDYLTTMSTGEI